MSAAPGQNGAIVSSVPSALISAGCMDSWVQRYERAGHAYIKSFSYLFQKSLIKTWVKCQHAAWQDVMAPLRVIFFTFFSSQILGEERAVTDLNGHWWACLLLTCWQMGDNKSMFKVLSPLDSFIAQRDSWESLEPWKATPAQRKRWCSSCTNKAQHRMIYCGMRCTGTWPAGQFGSSLGV